MTLRVVAMAGLLLAAGCMPAQQGTARPQAQMAPVPAVASPGAPGPEQTFRGRFVIGFERSSFDGCWVDQGRYWGTFEVPPAGSGGAAVYEVEFRGRRSDMVVPPGAELGFRGFGHMGRYACQIEMVKLVWKTRLE